MTQTLSYYDTIPRYLPLKVNLSYVPNIYDTINFDFIEIPSNISMKLKQLYNIDYTKFIPNNITTKETIMRKVMSVLLSYVNNSFEHLKDCMHVQSKLIEEFTSFSKSFTLGNMIAYPDNNNVMVDINNNMILVNSHNVLFVLGDNIIILNKTNNNIIMFSPTINYFESHDSTLLFKLFIKDNNSMVVNTVMNIPNDKIQRMSYNINSIGDVTTTYYYEKYENNVKILSYTLQKTNGDIEEKMIKNNLYIDHSYNKDTDTSKLISQCMMNDTTGLHYRGKYEETKSKGTTKKTLTKDDTIIYNKENNVVIVDMINNMTIKEDIIIGWKVAKSATNEKRIIKLAIPIDAKKIKPIDKEYFYTKGKERCNKAIVMDIQLPFEDNEISLVPTEMSAYSYIFNENAERFEYTVGKEVVPDMFDENENESCTNGIHFYRDRKNVFDVYVNK